MPRRLQGTAGARRLRHAVHWLRTTRQVRAYNRALSATAPTLSLYPGRPQPKASILRIAQRLGLRIGFSPNAEGAVIAWDDGAYFDPKAARRLPAAAINGRCLDVSKSTVDRLWAEVAGYGVSVDPLVTEGPIVVKSERNGTNDGELVMGPLARRRDGYVYQRLIEGVRDGRVYNTRALVMGDQIPLAVEKWRPLPNWFHGGTVVEPAAPADLWSADEMDLILRFCAAIRLDYGEVDVLRDNSTDRIFIIDANRTPIRPIGLDARHDDKIYGVMAEAFEAAFGDRLRAR